MPNIVCRRRWRDASDGYRFGKWQRLWSAAPAQVKPALDAPGRTKPGSFSVARARCAGYLIVSRAAVGIFFRFVAIIRTIMGVFLYNEFMCAISKMVPHTYKYKSEASFNDQQ